MAKHTTKRFNATHERRKRLGLCQQCGGPKGVRKAICYDCAQRKRKQNAARFESRRAAGICVYCGKRPSAPGIQSCVECRDRDYGSHKVTRDDQRARGEPTYSAKYLRKFKDAGICTNCRERPSRIGGQLCERCRTDANERGRKKNRELFAAGLCTKCGLEPLAPHRRMCKTCGEAVAQKKREQKQTRKAQGLCSECGLRPRLPGMQRCEQCQLDKRQRYLALRKEVVAAYGDCCACCGESNFYFLVIDHVNGGGNQDRLRNGGVLGILRRIKKEGYPDDYQCLCSNCNSAKSYYGSCPHTWPAEDLNDPNYLSFISRLTPHWRQGRGTLAVAKGTQLEL